MKITLAWYRVAQSLIEINQHFRGNFCLSLQGKRRRQQVCLK